MSAADPAGPRCFCRDCLADLDMSVRRCSACGSPRLVRHRALASLTIAHIDCDAFYATVEKRDNPDIADKPVIIGGGKRGVVSAACYIARTYGVRSAMPMFKALEACPHATVIGPDMAKYVRVGREVRQAMQALTPLVEPLSIDEAFLDLSGTERVHGMVPAKVLARFARDVERDIGITVSVGLSCNKFLAKIASDLDKPRGFAALDQEEARVMLAEKPVGFIFGVGPATQERLVQRGFRIIADLQKADEIEMMRQFPSEGRRLWRLARGIDDRRVEADRGAKTISSETTFETDIRDFAVAGEDPVAALREDVVAAQEQRACRLDRHAETEDRRFPSAHALAIDRGADAACRKDLFDLPRDAGERNRRHRLPPDGCRRQRAARRLSRRRHRHARPPRRACRAGRGQSAQEVRQRRRHSRHRV